MKAKHLSLILGLLVVVLAVVAIFFGFANAFADYDGLPASRGTLFQVMFGQDTDTGYAALPLIIAAFVMFIVAAVVALISAVFPFKMFKMGGFLLAALLLAVGAVFVFFTSNLWVAANADRSYAIQADQIKNGVGVIGMAISALAGALLSVYCFMVAKRS